MIDQADFRELMSRLPSPVCVVTTDGPAGLAGLTVSAACSVTDTPPTMLVCVNRSSRSYAALMENREICINVLGSRQQEIAMRFASSKGDMAEKFEGLPTHKLRGGAPAIEGCLASLDCSIVKTADIGTHTVLFCEVHASSSEEDEGLTYFRRAFLCLS
ncbi:flavin reductase family protein [Acetobacter sp.]|uniref:flavin reductase family protein n=1 Tax=Acetobacter sp. TaxID=440 RepID=UPI0039E7D8A7